MKNFTLVAAMAAVALTANAQYTCDPSNNEVLKNNITSVDYFVLSDAAVAKFQNKGAKMNYIGPDDQNGHPLYYWAGIAAGDESMPRVDFDEGGYISNKIIGDAGWSGAGINIKDTNRIDISDINDDTHFHMAIMTPSGNAPESVCFILLDDQNRGSMPAKFSIGKAFNDNGTIIPTINGGAAITTEWQGVDITVGTLKKIWPAFNMNNQKDWEGNSLSWLAGNIANSDFAIDAVYFYNVGEGSGISNVEGENNGLVVSNQTVSVLGGNGIEIYDLSGCKVAATNGNTLGIDNLPAGVYVARSGNSVEKIAIR